MPYYLKYWVELGSVIAVGFVSSLAVGLTVAAAFRQKMPTYQLLFSSFVMAVVICAVTSFCGIFMLSLSPYLIEMGVLFGLSWTSYIVVGYLIVIGPLISVTLLLLRQARSRGIKRWAVLGAVIPWGIVSVLAVGANVVFLTTDIFDRQVPEFFVACVAASMAIVIIVGSCAGGMIYHQTRHLRN